MARKEAEASRRVLTKEDPLCRYIKHQSVWGHVSKLFMLIALTGTREELGGLLKCPPRHTRGLNRGTAGTESGP